MPRPQRRRLPIPARTAQRGSSTRSRSTAPARMRPRTSRAGTAVAEAPAKAQGAALRAQRALAQAVVQAVAARARPAALLRPAAPATQTARQRVPAAVAHILTVARRPPPRRTPFSSPALSPDRSFTPRTDSAPPRRCRACTANPVQASGLCRATPVTRRCSPAFSPSSCCRWAVTSGCAHGAALPVRDLRPRVGHRARSAAPSRGAIAAPRLPLPG